MAARRPYWSGQIRLALVFLPVQLYSAVRRSDTVTLHEIDRQNNERIHHKNVTADGTEVERDEIAKAFEVVKGEYVILEPEEIDAIKTPSSDTLELVQFVSPKDLPPMHLERPYYVLPDGKNASEIYHVLRTALEESGKIGVGQIALRGREELCALIPYQNGLIVETLRYPSEVHPAEDFFADIPDRKVSADYVEMAKALIKKNSGKPSLAQFHDHYHEALKELVAAKQEDRKPVYQAAEKPSGKVVNLMDALKASLAGEDGKVVKKKAAAASPKDRARAKPVTRKATAKKTATRRAGS